MQYPEHQVSQHFVGNRPLNGALNGAADVNMSSLPTRQCVTFLVKDAHLPTKKKRSMTVRYHNAKHERW